MNRVRLAILTEIDQEDVHRKEEGFVSPYLMRKSDAGMADLFQCGMHLQHLSQFCRCQIVGFDFPDSEVATVSGGGFPLAEEEFTSGHLTKVQISGVVDDAPAVGIFVVDTYFHQHFSS